MPTPTAIIHFRSTNFIGGPEKQILTHCKNLSQESEFGCFLVSFDEPGGRELQKTGAESGIETLLLSPKIWHLPQNVRTLAKFIKNNNVAIVCCHDYKTEAHCVVLKKLIAVKTIGFSRGSTAENLKMRFFSWLDFFLIRWNDAVVAVSNAQQTKLIDKKVPQKKIAVIENAMTNPAYSQNTEQHQANLRAELKIPPQSKIILSAGRLSDEKGHIHLIEAVIELIQQGADIHLAIAGDGVLKDQFQDLVQKTATTGRVHLLGHRTDMTNLYQSADIFVLPSLSEGLPNALLEAMTNSLAVIATKVGGVPEVVQDQKNGLLCPPGNSNAIAEKLSLLLNDTTLCSRLASEGNASVHQQFSPSKQTEKLLSLYQKLIADA